MNKKAIFKVKTPYGLTEECTIHDIVEQGTVLGSTAYRASDVSVCGTNKGVCVGTAQVSSLLYVDDTIDISGSSHDAETAHTNALVFEKKKKLTYSITKCKTMKMNSKKKDATPNLYIGEEKIEEVEKIIYLGDIINNKGSNSDLIEDRVKRGTSAMVRIEALIREVAVGVHTTSLHVLLYQSLFVPSIFFNSESWSNLRVKDTETLAGLQLKMLKKIMRVPLSTTNSFTFLEMGILPVQYVIEIRQLCFLHHITSLEDNDPVKIMWKNQKELSSEGEKNWWSGVSSVMQKYGIIEEDTKLGKAKYKNKVKEAVERVAFENLKMKCISKSKTTHLQYKELRMQTYLKCMYQKQGKIVFQIRSKSLNIKTYCPYRYKDKICRKCDVDEESLKHITNCGYRNMVDTAILESGVELTVDVMPRVLIIVQRVEAFCELVDIYI